MKGVVYAFYINPPSSRNLETQREDFHRIDYLIESLLEDLKDLLPPGYTIDKTKEIE